MSTEDTEFDLLQQRENNHVPRLFTIGDRVQWVGEGTAHTVFVISRIDEDYTEIIDEEHGDKTIAPFDELMHYEEAEVTSILDELQGFSVGDQVIFNNQEFTIMLFGFNSKPITADIERDGTKFTVTLQSITKASTTKSFNTATELPVSHHSLTMSPPADNKANKPKFELASKVYVGLQPHIFLGTWDDGTAVLKTKTGNHIHVPFEDITSVPKGITKEYPVPLKHKLFKEGDKVYVGLQLYTFVAMHDLNHAILKRNDGALVTFAIERVYIPKKESEEIHTGGSSSYYITQVLNPTTLSEDYEAECNDIIESLKMTYAEANMFKAIWRNAASRQGKKKKGNNGVYDAEKCVFFAARMLIAEQENAKDEP